jgi:folate-binding protein YgfZ
LAAHFALLKNEGLLHIAGPDALTFLQGQTTCDTRKVDPEHALPGAYCTPKGRMVCDFLLVQLGTEHYGLRMRDDVIAPAAAAFGKYIMFSKAELDEARTDWQVAACWGEDVKAVLAASGFAVPSARYESAGGDGCVLVQMDDQGEQIEVYIDSQSQSHHIKALQQALDAGSAEQWQALQIEAGIGRIEGPTSGEFLPQMLNYDITGHVSFNKGCYTGQEIVARLHYRGKAKRRLYLAQLDKSAPLPAGTDLFSPDSEQPGGTVVNSAPTVAGCVCLVTATESAIAGGLRTSDNDHELVPGTLPYALTE